MLLFLGTVGCGFAGSMRQLIAARFLSRFLLQLAAILTTCKDRRMWRRRHLYDGEHHHLRPLQHARAKHHPRNREHFQRYRHGTRRTTRWLHLRSLRLAPLLHKYVLLHPLDDLPTPFAVQLPLFFLAFFLTQYFLTYHTPGKARSPLAIFARIDYLGSLALLLTIGCTLFALSYKFNRDVPWEDRRVWGCFAGAALGVAAFVLVEVKVAKEPVLAPGLLRMRVPLLVGVNSLFIPLCNFGVMCEFASSKWGRGES